MMDDELITEEQAILLTRILHRSGRNMIVKFWAEFGNVLLVEPHEMLDIIAWLKENIPEYEQYLLPTKEIIDASLQKIVDLLHG